LTSHD
jgi:polysaccharide biosynthesis transport protein